MIAPLIVIPVIAYNFNNWYLLFDIAFCYIGAALAKRFEIIFYGLTCFCIGFWIKSGFNIHQYITLFFFCLFGGFLFSKMADEYESSIEKENTNYLQLEDSLKKSKELIDLKISDYKKVHPDEEMTVEKIKEITDNHFYDEALEEIKRLKK